MRHLKSKSIFKISVILIIAWITYTIYFGYIDRTVSSGFQFSNRLPPTIYQLNGLNVDSIDIDNTNSNTFPLAPVYLTLLSRLFAMDILDIIYFPILSTIPILFYLVLSKNLIKPRTLAYIIAIITFIFRWGRESHIKEYALGKVIFPLFIFAVIAYIMKKDWRFSVISIILFLHVKFTSPHTEVWIISFLFFSILFILMLLKLDSSLLDLPSLPNASSILIPFSSIYFVLFFAYNRKIFNSLIPVHLFRDLRPVDTFENFVYQILNPDSSMTHDFGTAPQSPGLYSDIVVIYYATVALGVLLLSLGIIYTINYIKKEDWLKYLNLKDILAIAVMTSIFPDFLVLASLGLIQLEILYLLTPVILIYSFSRINDISTDIGIEKLRKGCQISIIIFVVVLAFSGLSGVVLFHNSSVDQSIGYTSANEHAADWIYTTESNEYLTDLHTFGIIQTHAATLGYNPDKSSHIQYSDNIYSKLVGENQASGEDFDVYVINWYLKDAPLQRGHPDWAYFEPISNHKQNIKMNNDINKVYDSNSYKMYSS